MVILAFLQNQWFKNPARARDIRDRCYIARGKTQEDFNFDMLFLGCHTGKMLRKYLGDELCEEIIWAEASPEVGHYSGHAPRADHAHMMDIVSKYKPDIILGFGRIACDALDLIDTKKLWTRVHGPHPAARYPGARRDLEQMASEVRSAILDYKAKHRDAVQHQAPRTGTHRSLLGDDRRASLSQDDRGSGRSDP